jgi:nucleoside phosphorylase
VGAILHAVNQQHLLICFAVPEEARSFKRQIRDVPDIRVLITGMGEANAKRSVTHALDLERPSAVLTCGFAGGLRKNLAKGAVLFEASQGSPLAAILGSTGALTGKFHCSPKVVVTAAEKEILARRTGADAVEMESGPIVTLCEARGVPCATVRVILDRLDQDLPLNFNELMTSEFRMNYLKLAVAVLSQPSKISELLAFQKDCQMAAEKLADVLKLVVLERNKLIDS